jgi:acyl dehydratase
MSTPAEICFEDFVPGEVATFGDRVVEKDEIVAFAAEFDPQPFHLSEAAAKATFAGGLIASGWHTNAIMNRMNCDAYFNRSSCIGSPGIDEVKWLKPLRPGDRLRMRRTILEAVPSRSRPDRGMVRFANDLFNQDGALVCHHNAMVLFLRRHPGTTVDAAPKTMSAKDAPLAELSAREAPAEAGGNFFEDLTIGDTSVLGDYSFDAATIDRFAQAYDNQRFHVDPVAAAASPFGGIVASGWHTAAAWMVTMIRHQDEERKRLAAKGLPVARLGVSPGVRAIRWLAPVRPGDRLTYISRIIDKRVSSTRPGWGLVSHQNVAVNQHDAVVFSFSGAVFWEARRP